MKPVTAGLRGADWDPEKLPSDMKQESIVTQTQDGATVRGILYSRGGESTVVTLQHPRESIATHYMVPELLSGGVAVYLQGARSVGNDIRLEHETALYDVAAGIHVMKARGYESVVLLGNSGGAGLYTFYLQQANAASGDRIKRSPGGRPTKLEEADLPTADGLILVSPHLGQGVLLLNSLDPSVTNEQDAMSFDPSLSPFMPPNGFKRPPESSSYSPEFIEKYRAAQVARCERIDAFARDQIAVRMTARKKLKEGKASPLDRIAAMHTPIFNVWRTDADLRSWDQSIDPSNRRYGSLWGPNPFASNWGSIGFGRVCTAESWLSTWSGLSSNASMTKCGPDVTQPTLLIRYDGDATVFTQDADTMFDAIGAEDKEHLVFPGDHHGRPVSADAAEGRSSAGDACRTWLKKRFQTHER